MPTRRKTTPPQDETLLDVNLTPTGERRRPGRVEARVAKAIRAARTRGVIDDLEDPLAVSALVLAQAMDRAAVTKPDPYAVVAASRELREVLLALSFAKPTPASSAPASNPQLDAFLSSLGEPEPAEA